MTRSRLLAPIAVLATLVAVPAAAQAVDGSYHLLKIYGSSLPARSSADDGSKVQSGSVAFGTDGRFTLSMTLRTEEGRESRQDVAGTYVLGVDSIRFTPGVPLGDSGAVRWDRDGDTLRLLVRSMGDYLFVREPAAVMGNAWSPGRYELTHLNGDEVPALVPNTGGYRVLELTLELTPDGRWTWTELGGSGSPATHSESGRYTVAGEKLVLTRERGSPDEFLWTLRNGTLRLVDDEGTVLLLMRR